MTAGAEHACEQERWLDYQVFQHREDVRLLATEFAEYLASAQGRFAVWYAERERKRFQAEA